MKALESYAIPSRFPSYACLGLLCGSLLSFCSGVLWYRHAPPLQSFYAKTYISSTVRTWMHTKKPQSYGVFVHSCSPYGQCLSSDANLAADPQLRTAQYIFVERAPEQMSQQLLAVIYGGSFQDAIRWPLYASGVFLVIGLAVGSLYDKRRTRAYREGVKIHGRDLLTVDQLNKRLRGDGFEIWTEI